MTKSNLLYAAILSACAVLAPNAIAQPAPTLAHKLEFDAVSIHPSQRKFVMIGTDFLDPVGKMAPPAGGHFSWNIQLVSLISFAYDLRSFQLQRQASQGLPKPFNTAQDGWFAVEARAEGNPTRDDVRQMVRSMLEERFHFAAHIEKREGDVSELVLDKQGLGLKPHAEGDPCTLPPSMTDSARYPHVYPSYEQVKARCGIFNRELTHSGERRLEMLDVTLDQIANTLSAATIMYDGQGLPVVDNTRLQGHYDAVLEYGPPVPPDAASPNASDALGSPPVPVALQKQLGLKLVKQKAQVDVFVIDHIEPPTEN
jgi:bla regulator protein blaR1